MLNELAALCGDSRFDLLTSRRIGISGQIGRASNWSFAIGQSTLGRLGPTDTKSKI